MTRLLPLLVLVLVGCGTGVKLHPVTGQVTFADGEVATLAGHHVEVALIEQPTQRANGIIRPDGSFVLETLDAGTFRQGAQAGTYQVRILLADEDDQGNHLPRPPLARRYFSFAESGLSLTVPSGAVTLTVSKR
jgi:hypothetical protein